LLLLFFEKEKAMRNVVEDRLSMFLKVSGLLKLHKEELLELPIVVSYKDTLQAMIVEMLAVASKAGIDITGYAVDKDIKRKEMIAAIKTIATALVALGITEEDEKTQELYGVTEAEMEAMRENDLFVFAKTVLDGGAPLLEKLLVFGVDTADFEQAEAAVEAFFDSIKAPQEQVQQRKRSTKELDEKALAIGHFLTDKLDKVMELFSTRNPGLYKSYRLCRKIDSSATGNRATHTGTVPPESIVAVCTDVLKGHIIDIENSGTVLLECCLSATEHDMEGNIQRIKPKTGLSISASELNPEAEAVFLLVKNNYATAGAYRIWIS